MQASKRNIPGRCEVSEVEERSELCTKCLSVGPNRGIRLCEGKGVELVAQSFGIVDGKSLNGRPETIQSYLYRRQPSDEDNTILKFSSRSEAVINDCARLAPCPPGKMHASGTVRVTCQECVPPLPVMVPFSLVLIIYRQGGHEFLTSDSYA